MGLEIITGTKLEKEIFQQKEEIVWLYFIVYEKNVSQLNIAANVTTYQVLDKYNCRILSDNRPIINISAPIGY